MKGFFFLLSAVLLVAFATAVPQPKNCVPNPPINARVDSVTSTTINVSFEDPDDSSCPIVAYETSWQPALSNVLPKDAEGEGN
uniref:fibronectin type III domain-containing protein n=1 Tax=Salmonella enterica TaxID=28901 RepID=UPI00329740B2